MDEPSGFASFARFRFNGYQNEIVDPRCRIFSGFQHRHARPNAAAGRVVLAFTLPNSPPITIFAGA